MLLSNLGFSCEVERTLKCLMEQSSSYPQRKAAARTKVAVNTLRPRQTVYLSIRLTGKRCDLGVVSLDAKQIVTKSSCLCKNIYRWIGLSVCSPNALLRKNTKFVYAITACHHQEAMLADGEIHRLVIGRVALVAKAKVSVLHGSAIIVSSRQ